MKTLIKVGIIGLGRMGQFYLEEMQKSGRWQIAYICDTHPQSRELAQKLSPNSVVTDNEQLIFDDPEVQVVGLFALANSRKEQIEKAVLSGKHIISEKPISDTIIREWESVHIAEKSNLLATVNMYLRNTWYHRRIKELISIDRKSTRLNSSH